LASCVPGGSVRQRARIEAAMSKAGGVTKAKVIPVVEVVSEVAPVKVKTKAAKSVKNKK
jgi:hypothetical protein